MVELIDMFYPTPFNIILVVTIYIIHRAFHKVDMLGFAVGTVIALTENFFLVKYMNVHPLIAMVFTIVLFPFMEILWGMAAKGFRKEEEIHHWRMPHPHLMHSQISGQVTRTAYGRR